MPSRETVNYHLDRSGGSYSEAIKNTSNRVVGIWQRAFTASAKGGGPVPMDYGLTQGGTSRYSFSAIGWAPADYEEGKYSTQAMARYIMDVNVSVYKVPIYDSDFNIVD